MAQEDSLQKLKKLEHESVMDSKDCPFCGIEVTSRIIERTGTVMAIKDKYPVTEHHMLIIPVRHTPDFFPLTSKERRDLDALILALRKRLLKSDPNITGFNIGVNCGVSAGQTIMHAHIHLIPRRDRDIPNPRGCVRGVIPDKMAERACPL